MAPRIEDRMLKALRRTANERVRVPDNGKIHVRLEWLLRKDPPTILVGDLWRNVYSGDERYCISTKEV